MPSAGFPIKNHSALFLEKIYHMNTRQLMLRSARTEINGLYSLRLTAGVCRALIVHSYLKGTPHVE